MRVLVIDAQGGGIGRALIERLRERMPEAEILAVGTNAIATTAMLKAGATAAATGENAVCVCAAKCNIIAGPIGIVLKDAMMGEITERIALAVGGANAQRVLVPMQRCSTSVAGTEGIPVQSLIDSAVETIVKLMNR